ncbi:toxin-antitoxin system TumE family protein [Desulfothermus sp.]
MVEIKIWKVKKTQDKPQGLKYSLVYIEKGKRIIGYDNAEGKGDHRHYWIKNIPINLQA